MYNFKEHTCTRCGREISDIEVTITLGISAQRKKDSGIWENIANLDQTSTEILCPDCFNIFCEAMNTLNYRAEEPSQQPQSRPQDTPQRSSRSGTSETIITEQKPNSGFNPSFNTPNPAEKFPSTLYGVRVDDQVDYR